MRAESPLSVERPRNQASIFAPALVILVGLLLRIAMLGVDVRFHPDEALFAAQARLISDNGDWLLRTTDLDKPPLTFYTSALSFTALPPSEFAARLPNVLFSGLTVALLHSLARALYRDRMTALVAAALLALSPYELAFAATVFTDVQASFWVLTACMLAARDRWAWAGVTAALMVAAKSTALMFLPMILALGLAHNAPNEWRIRDVMARLRAFAWPLIAGLVMLIAWDAARAPRSFIDLGFTRNNPGRLIRSGELWPRAEQWAHWLGFITGSRAVNIVAVAAIPAWLVSRIRLATRRAVIDWLIAGYSAAFLGWYWLVAFNTYDRYIHTLVPFIVLLLARALVSLWRLLGARPVVRVIVTGCIATALLGPVSTTLRGEIPVGGDQGTHTGIDALAGYLNTALRGEGVYDHWLGWELAYYLGSSPKVVIQYTPRPEALAESAVRPGAPRYVAAPSPRAAAPWIAALEHVGVRAVRVYHDDRHNFAVYQLYTDQY